MEDVLSISKNGIKDRNELVDISTMGETIIQELNTYKQCIRNFFSKRGEAAGIHSMYEKLSTGRNEYTMIDAIDLCRAGSTYKEYIDGMNSFLNELFNASESNIDPSKENFYQAKIDRATCNNDAFVQSLFGGQNNQSVQQTLKDACCNIEYLIDFLNELETFINRSTELVNDHGSNEQKLIIDSCRLYFNSISMYCANVIDCVFKTYTSIQESLSGIRRLNAIQEQSPKYQLF